MKIERDEIKMASEINVNEVRASAFSLLPVSECSRLAKEVIPTQPASKSALVSPSTTATANANCNAIYANNNSSSSNGNSQKMGSRRIFTPQFKLQVLESYRSDSDCKGNQRATARKYNIHRRQIQKWLQCESNLRSSVANINQNSVKHQFHNISHHQQQQAPQPPRIQLPHSTTSASLNGASNGYNHHPHHHSQAIALNSLNVPSMQQRLDSTSSASAQGVLAAANLAAAVAVAIASTSSPSTATTAVSPLRPTAINGTGAGVSNGVSKISSSLLHSHHHHHHHHFPISPYTHSPVPGPVPVTVPILSHHLGAPQPQPHALHQHYQYHNLPPHTHSHPLRLSHQPSAFLPTTCLPVNVLSAVAAASTTDIPEMTAEVNHTDVNVKDELEDTTSSAITTTSATAVHSTITAPANTVLTGNMHGYIYEDNDYESMYRKAACVDSDNMRDAKCKTYLPNSAYQFAEQDCLGAAMTIPMDLSLGRKRHNSAVTEDNAIGTKCHLRENSNSSAQIVDLTFRKRKVIATSALSTDTEQPQKLAKRLEESDSTKTSSEFSNVDENVANQSTNDEDEEVEIEVDVEAKQKSSKPVKLFKPYLLDNNDDYDQSATENQKSANSELSIGEQREPIIWINHPAYDSSRASSMYSPSVEKPTFHGGSPYFHASKPSSPQNVLSPISTASISPTNFLRCPKGSPVSGYESSSSICSERDETCSLTECRSFSLDFQMQTAPENKLTTQPLHIRQWLDQDTIAETNTPPLARASIALYA